MVVKTRSETALKDKAGAQQTTKTHEDIRESLLYFRFENISSGLGTKQVFDDELEEYGPVEPQFYLKFGDKYANIPKTSEALIALGKYLMQVGEAIDGVVFKTHVEHTSEDVRNAKDRLDPFRKKVS